MSEKPSMDPFASQPLDVAQLENLVEELGGDTRLCLERGRAMAGEKEK